MGKDENVAVQLWVMIWAHSNVIIEFQEPNKRVEREVVRYGDDYE